MCYKCDKLREILTSANKRTTDIVGSGPDKKTDRQVIDKVIQIATETRNDLLELIGLDAKEISDDIFEAVNNIKNASDSRLH